MSAKHPLIAASLSNYLKMRVVGDLVGLFVATTFVHVLDPFP